LQKGIARRIRGRHEEGQRQEKRVHRDLRAGLCACCSPRRVKAS
jgi:hypothetical protein